MFLYKTNCTVTQISDKLKKKKVKNNPNVICEFLEFNINSTKYAIELSSRERQELIKIRVSQNHRNLPYKGLCQTHRQTNCGMSRVRVRDVPYNTRKELKEHGPNEKLIQL